MFSPSKIFNRAATSAVPAPPKHIARRDTREVDGAEKAHPCPVLARALRPVAIHHYRVDKGETIDLSEAEFASHSHLFEKVADVPLAR